MVENLIENMVNYLACKVVSQAHLERTVYVEMLIAPTNGNFTGTIM